MLWLAYILPYMSKQSVGRQWEVCVHMPAEHFFLVGRVPGMPSGLRDVHGRFVRSMRELSVRPPSAEQRAVSADVQQSAVPRSVVRHVPGL